MRFGSSVLNVMERHWRCRTTDDDVRRKVEVDDRESRQHLRRLQARYGAFSQQPYAGERGHLALLTRRVRHAQGSFISDRLTRPSSHKIVVHSLGNLARFEISPCVCVVAGGDDGRSRLRGRDAKFMPRRCLDHYSHALVLTTTTMNGVSLSMPLVEHPTCISHGPLNEY